MAYTIREKPRRGGQWAEDGSRRYPREFQVTSDEVLDGAAVMLLTGIPRIQDYYLPTDLNARCVSSNAEMDGDGYHWKVRSEYSTKYPEPGQENENPLLRPAKIRWSSVKAQRVRAYDINGDPFENVNGEPLQSPPPIIYTQLRVVITRNEASFDSQLPYTYGNTKNSAPWYGYPTGKVSCEEIVGESMWENDVAYAAVTYSFLVDKYGFDEELLNVGTMYRQTPGGVLQPCQVNGVLTTIPQKLAADGTLLPEGGTPHYLTFVVREAKDYGALLL